VNDDDELDFERLARPSTVFLKHIVELAPAQSLRCDAQAMQDAILILTAGEIELECSGGARHRFNRGAVLCLAPLQPSVVRNVGAAAARLLAISRRAAGPEDRGRDPATDLRRKGRSSP
jgi:glyoxylate utilization-related uncharacterized protein